MKVTSKVFGMCLAMALCLPLHAGKVYKWQDEDGAWHYSEKPPLERPAETLKLKTRKPAPESSGATDDTEAAPATEGEDEDKKPLKKSPEVLAAEKARRAEDCERAKKNLDTLTHRTRILYDDEEKGEQRYLTEEERQEWLQKSRDQVKEFCN